MTGPQLALMGDMEPVWGRLLAETIAKIRFSINWFS
jgi:hypothetical protein